MKPETWASLAAGVFLVAATIAQGLGLLRKPPGSRRWEQVAAAARLGSIIALTTSLVLATVEHGEWSPSDLRQVTLGLALATLIIHQLLSRALHTSHHAGPVIDVVVLAFILIDAFLVQPGGPLLNCAQRAVPYQIQWILFLLGSGSAVVAGTAGLFRCFYRWSVVGRGILHLPPMSRTHSLLRNASTLALLFLGAGIVVSAWWSWRTIGSPAADDPRVAWIAVSWFAAAMSEVAWLLDGQLPGPGERQGQGRWAALLAALSGTTAIMALLVVMDLRRLLGI
jgi:hypothetical protein